MRFWKRGEDKGIEQLLRTNRPEPGDEFASAILKSISGTPAPAATRRTRSPRRLGLALAVTVIAVALAGVLGGISAASAGLGKIAHVASKAVTPSHPQSNTVNATASAKNSDKAKGDDPADSDKGQYQVGVCHWANHKYVLIFVSPQGAANHLKHHPNDKLPVNGHC